MDQSTTETRGVDLFQQGRLRIFTQHSHVGHNMRPDLERVSTSSVMVRQVVQRMCFGEDLT
jgi:hypothetical protein